MSAAADVAPDALHAYTARYAVRSTANPQATDKAEKLHSGCIAEILTWQKRAYSLQTDKHHVPPKLSMHQSQQQTLKPQLRLRGCIDCSQILCENAGRLAMPQATDKAERLC